MDNSSTFKTEWMAVHQMIQLPSLPTELRTAKITQRYQAPPICYRFIVDAIIVEERIHSSLSKSHCRSLRPCVEVIDPHAEWWWKPPTAFPSLPRYRRRFREKRELMPCALALAFHFGRLRESSVILTGRSRYCAPCGEWPPVSTEKPTSLRKSPVSRKAHDL